MSQSEPIAIVGSGCRFAGGIDSPSKLWELLREPRDIRREIPRERFSVQGFYHPDGAYHGHSNVQHAYLLEQDPSHFDTDFFGT
jgi:acyl transferase domain-containing protein